MTLHVERIGYAYEDGNPRLERVSFAIGPGRRTVILGPNGAGKSTLLALMHGRLRPRSGRICFAGRTLRYRQDELEAWRHTVSLLRAHAADLLSAGTVLQEVAATPAQLGLDPLSARARAGEMLSQLRLSHLAERPTSLLSGGERIRVALACLLAADPQVLLCDEPTAGLDAEGASHVLTMLDELAAAGITPVLATCDPDLALAWAEDAIALVDGRVVSGGEVRAVFAKLQARGISAIARPRVMKLFDRLQQAGWVDPRLSAPRTLDDLGDWLVGLPAPARNGAVADCEGSADSP